MYGCMDCFAEGRTPVEACIVVEPDAEDPVVGGYNREGALCPLRYVGPQQSGRLVTPMSCPSFLVTPFHGPVDASTANRSPSGSRSTSYGNNSHLYGSTQLRFWICPLHRPKYIQLGPSFAGYELARRIEFVEVQKRASTLALETAKGKQKQERWDEVFNVGSGPQSHTNQKRKREAGVKGGEADATVDIAAAACSLLEAADSSRYQEQKRRRGYTAGADIPGL